MRSHVNVDAAEMIAVIKTLVMPNTQFYKHRFGCHPKLDALIINVNLVYQNADRAHRNVSFLFAKDTCVWVTSKENAAVKPEDFVGVKMLGSHTTEWAAIVSNALQEQHFVLCNEARQGDTSIAPVDVHQNNTIFVNRAATKVRILVSNDEVTAVETFDWAT